MNLVGLDEHDVASLDVAQLTVLLDPAAALDDEDFVLVVVAVMRRVAAGLDGEVPHREVGRAIGPSDHHAHGHALDAIHLHWRPGNLICASNQHVRLSLHYPSLYSDSSV